MIIAAQADKFTLDIFFHLFVPVVIAIAVIVIADGIMIKRATRKKMDELDDKRKKMDNYKKGIK